MEASDSSPSALEWRGFPVSIHMGENPCDGGVTGPLTFWVLRLKVPEMGVARILVIFYPRTDTVGVIRTRAQGLLFLCPSVPLVRCEGP